MSRLREDLGAVAGVVLAAGRSTRLGTPKQVLPFGDTTLLGATVAAARACRFGELIVTLGGSADTVLERVPLDDAIVTIVDDEGAGSAGSLRAALARVGPSARGVVLMLGDQPGVTPRVVQALIAQGGSHPIALCQYTDGLGHPFWISRGVFGDLSTLHGDKALWQLVQSGKVEYRSVPIDARVPLDVDTWDDYRRLLASDQ